MHPHLLHHQESNSELWHKPVTEPGFISWRAQNVGRDTVPVAWNLMWISSISNRHLSSNAAALVGPHIRVVRKCILWCPWCSWITRSHQTSSGHCKGNGTVSILWWKLHHRVQVIEFKCWWRYEHERSWKGITKAFGWVCVLFCSLPHKTESLCSLCLHSESFCSCTLLWFNYSTVNPFASH